MDLKDFWELIDRTKRSSTDEQLNALVLELSNLSEPEIIDFERIDLKKGDRKRLTELQEVVKLALAHERAVRHESVH